MSSFEVIRWDSNFHWGEELKRYFQESQREFFLVVKDAGEFDNGFLKSHLEFHNRFPFSIAQGEFYFRIAQEEFNPFSEIPDGANLPIAIPLNLSFPKEILRYFNSFNQLEDAIDFVFELIQVAASQLIPIYYVSKPRMSYKIEEIPADLFKQKCEESGRIIRGKVKKQAGRFVAACASSPPLQAFLETLIQSPYAYGGTKQKVIAHKAFHRGLSSPGNGSLRRIFSDDLRVGWIDSLPHFDGDFLSDKQIKSLWRLGIDLTRMKQSEARRIRFPIRISYLVPDGEAGNDAEYKIFFAGFPVIEQLKFMGEMMAYNEIWVPSFSYGEILMENGLKLPIRVIPYGIDFSVFRPQIFPSCLFPGFLSFLYVGDFEDPCLDILLEAYCEAFEKGERTLLVLASEPLLNEEYYRKLSKIEDKIKLRRSNAPDIFIVPSFSNKFGGILSSCDVFVSLQTEGAPMLRLLQAAGSAKPLIVPSRGEWLKAFDPGSFGYLFNTKEEMKRALRLAYDEADTLAVKGANARQFSLEWSIEHSTVEMAKRIAEIHELRCGKNHS